MHKISKEQDHNHHWDEDTQTFDRCHQVVIHCEHPKEAEEVARLVSAWHRGEIEGSI